LDSSVAWMVYFRKMKKNLKHFVLVATISLIPTILIWLPFILRLPTVWGIPLPEDGLGTVVKNYDGPLYIVVAKSFYDPEVIQRTFQFNLPAEYYAAHLPLYPVLIRLVALISNFPYAMLLVTLASSVFCLWYFYLFIKQYTKDQAFWFTFVFALFPARWLIVRSIGSPEPLFLGAVIASVYYFQNKKYWLAALFGVIAQLTKSPAILLFIAYALYIVIPAIGYGFSTSIKNTFVKFNWRAYPLILMPVALLGVFFLYQLRMNDFLAYFHSGDNLHLFFPPFQIFNYSQPWVNTFWLEEIIFVYLFGALGISQLWKRKEYLLATFVAVFFTTTIFVSHRDLIRYSLPIVPFLFVAFAELIKQKEFKYIFAFIVIPIFLFSLAYISQNHMQISDWAPIL
jgi:hypothetical protein